MSSVLSVPDSMMTGCSDPPLPLPPVAIRRKKPVHYAFMHFRFMYKISRDNKNKIHGAVPGGRQQQQEHKTCPTMRLSRTTESLIYTEWGNELIQVKSYK